MSRFFIFLAIFSSVFALDLFTKHIIESKVPFGAVIEVLPFLNITHIRNRGIVFGFLSSSSEQVFWLITALSLVAFFLLLYFAIKLKGAYFYIFAGMLGGAFGNIFERLTKGYVVDFIDLHVGGWHWPAFNVADTAITLGMIAILLLSFKKQGSQQST